MSVRTALLVLALVVGAAGGAALTVEPTATTAPADGAAPAGGAAPADARQTQPATCDYEQLYNQTINSVALVRTGSGLGSGYVFRTFEGNDTSFVVTNEHVVGDAAQVLVRFDRGESVRGTVVGATALTDLAVVRVNATPGYVESLPLAESEPEPGEKVAALGSPFGLEGTITSGIVSGTDRRMQTEEGFTIPSTIQTDAPINPGNSGGPLVSCEDRSVLGINRAGGAENIGFAIPASVVRRVVPALIQNGEVEYSWLGVQVADVTDPVARANDLDVSRGVVVVRAFEGSPAAGTLQGATGFENVSGFRVPVGGDVVLAIDGQQVNTTQDLRTYLLTQTRPGDTVELTVIRNGERTNVTVTVAERPEGVDEA